MTGIPEDLTKLLGVIKGRMAEYNSLGNHACAPKRFSAQAQGIAPA